MNRYAIVEGIEVLNVIVADSLEIAQQCNPEKLCILLDDFSKAESGGQYINSEFIPKKPYNSWLWDGNRWKSPVDEPMQEIDSPSIRYMWDEENLQWIPA